MIFMKEDDAICLNDGEDVVTFPLMQEELELMIDDTNYFCNYINLRYESEDLSNETVVTNLKNQLAKMKEDKQNNIWHAIWVVVSVKQKAIVGRINFLGTPDVTGKVQTDFYTHVPYRRRGIMTSAINLVSTFALDNGASLVEAIVQKDNLPAQKVLDNNKFEKVVNEETIVYTKGK